MEKGTFCRAEMQSWPVGVRQAHLVQIEVASEAGSAKVSFDVSTSVLALW